MLGPPGLQPRRPGIRLFRCESEFIANVLVDWYRFTGTSTVFIDPGSP
ncbi:hypothetical protein FEAC_14550 [Ferrimicrobium acidiphilum DSM 19497]|jgi:hypothetical protein|uniref:Uncharacterized protein n=1 Tax=Ferrimicrobium acidiphilum DSM 19497 TaxID=1121877 RepID=A0A0D8FU59_9ACTN|nr:hypothetical protein FEAC_14550 [Ferrimicrobium acidiphilum DSM 19497]